MSCFRNARQLEKQMCAIKLAVPKPSTSCSQLIMSRKRLLILIDIDRERLPNKGGRLIITRTEWVPRTFLSTWIRDVCSSVLFWSGCMEQPNSQEDRADWYLRILVFGVQSHQTYKGLLSFTACEVISLFKDYNMTCNAWLRPFTCEFVYIKQILKSKSWKQEWKNESAIMYFL